MYSLNSDYAAGLLDACEPPCLSLYQPTHRHYPDNRQDPIRFRNLVKVLEESLLQQYPTKDIKPVLDQFRALAADRDFWNHTLDGLAVLGASGILRVFRLQRSVAELVVVADSFHTKPLIRILQSADRYQVLGLSRHEAKLFEGNRDVLDEIELAPGIPRTMTEALGEQVTEPHQTVASYGGVGGSNTPMYHGHGGKETEVDLDEERFFRAIDPGILEHHSRPSALPLILATLPQHRQLFHTISRNPFLIEQSIDIHPDALPITELCKQAWQAFEPHYRARLASLVEEFGGAKADGLGEDHLQRVAKAVAAGRVKTLLIESNCEVPGQLDAATGDITLADLAHPEVDDVLDDLGTLTLKMGGDVVVVPTELMPAKTGVAAIYRY